MKKFVLIAITASLLPIAALAQTGTTGMVAAASPQKSALSAQDRSFLQVAAPAGMSEVQEGQLAASKGSSTVQNIGTRMVTDHTKVNNQLQSLASSKDVTLSEHVTASQAAEFTTLQGLSGAAFNTTYLKDQRLAHKQAIKLFKTEATSGNDPDLKTFASNTLPTLKAHLKMIEAAQ